MLDHMMNAGENRIDTCGETRWEFDPHAQSVPALSLTQFGHLFEQVQGQRGARQIDPQVQLQAVDDPRPPQADAPESPVWQVLIDWFQDAFIDQFQYPLGRPATGQAKFNQCQLGIVINNNAGQDSLIGHD